MRPARRGRGRARPGRPCWSTTPAARSGSTRSPTRVDDWQWMFDVNVLGTVRVTRALLPALDAQRRRHHRDHQLDGGPHRLRGRRRVRGGQARPDGAGRDAAPGAVRPPGPGGRDRPRHGADRRVRPGPLRRRRGEGGRRRTPGWRSRWSPTTSPTCVAFAATRPHHVNIDRLVVRPLAQAAQHKVHRSLEPTVRQLVAIANPPSATTCGEVVAGQREQLTSTGSGCSSTSKVLRTPSRISRASPSSAAVVPSPRLVNASVCLPETATPACPPWYPLWNPARSISQAALTLAVPTRPARPPARRRPCPAPAGAGRRTRPGRAPGS